MEKLYIIQSKRTNSLAVTIPAKITKEYGSIGVAQTKPLTLNATGTKVEKFKNIILPAVESFEAFTQQPSSKGVPL